MWFVDVNLAVHAPQDDRVNGKNKLGCPLESPLDALECGLKAKVASREVITSCCVDIFDTAQDILAVTVGAAVGHKFHEYTQAICGCW